MRFSMTRHLLAGPTLRLTCSGGSEPLRLVKLSLCIACTLGVASHTVFARAIKKVPAHGARHVATKSAGKPHASKRGLVNRHATKPSAAHRQSISRISGSRLGSRSSSPDVYSPPLLPHGQLALRSGTPGVHEEDSTASIPNTAVPAEPVIPLPVDDSAVHTVAQQLARGGGALQFPGALRHFFTALHQVRTEGARTVRVMQFGDSHTAADMFTGEARARMQALFGDGGIGFSYAGHPFAGYRILGSGRGQSGGWTTLGTHFTQLGDAELGLGGVAIQSSRAGESVSLDAPCRTLQVQYLRQPGGGSLQLTDNGAPVETAMTDSTQASGAADLGDGSRLSAGTQVSAGSTESSGSTGADAGSFRTNRPDLLSTEAASPPPVSQNAGLAGTLRYTCAGTGSHHFTLTAQGDGPVRLLGTVTLLPGITWEALGINGAEAPLMLRWNQPLFRSLLAAAEPDLIILAYGTNEAAAHWSEGEYQAAFGRLVDMLHRTSPAASVLVVGPADRSLGSTSYTIVGRGRRARRIAHRYFSPYSGTARIVAAQRDVCSTHDCAFWNWQARQGGLGAMNRWVSAGYAQPDHTHFTSVGYHALADALVADLLSAYSGYGPRAAAAAAQGTPHIKAASQ